MELLEKRYMDGDYTPFCDEAETSLKNVLPGKLEKPIPTRNVCVCAE